MILNKNAEKALRGKLLSLLKCIEYKEGAIDFTSFFNACTPFYKEVKKHFSNYLKDSDIFQIFLQFIFFNPNLPERCNDGTLQSCLKEEEFEDIFEDIFHYIMSLPMAFNIYFYMPNSTKLDTDKINICDGVSFLNEIPSPSRNIKKVNQAERKNELDGIYLQVHSEGFAEGAYKHSAVADAISILEQVLYLGQANGFFMKVHTKYRYINTPLCFQYDSENNYTSKREIRLPYHIEQLLHVLAINQIQMIKLGDQQKHVSYNDFQSFASSAFSPLKRLVKSQTSAASSIRTGIKWAFASSTNEEENVSFIQASVAFEAILGDNSSDNITRTLADRCAYSLGSNISEREDILSKFTKFYATRSKIVHGRKLRLDESDEYLYNWSNNILKTLILKEIAMLT